MIVCQVAMKALGMDAKSDAAFLAEPGEPGDDELVSHDGSLIPCG